MDVVGMCWSLKCVANAHGHTKIPSHKTGEFSWDQRAVTIWETNLKFESWQISFAYNLFHICPIILKFWKNTLHNSGTAVLYTNFQHDWLIEMDVMD